MMTTRVCKNKWNNLHPKFNEYLLKNASGDKVFIENRLVEGVDTKTIIKNGCVHSSQVYQGEICVNISLCSLVYHGFSDVIKLFLDTHADESSKGIQLLKTYFDSGKSEAVEKTHTLRFNLPDSSLLAVIAHVFLNEPDWAKSVLEKHKNAGASALEIPAIMLEKARVYKHLFNDNAEAIKYLEIAENNSLYVLDIVSCATARIELFQDETAAYHLMNQAENEASDTLQWLYCADGWRVHFDNAQAAKKCLGLAKDAIKLDYQFFDFINTHKLLFNDIQKIKELLIEVEHYEISKVNRMLVFENLPNLIKIWVDFLGEKEATDTLLRIEGLKNKVSHNITCAKLWLLYFNNKKKADILLTNASAKAKSVEELCECAQAWIELLENAKQAAKCLIEAEKNSVNTEHWTMLSLKWKELLRNEERGVKCLFEAEKTANEKENIESCVKIWNVTFNRKTDVERFLKLKEENAKCFSGWFTLTKIWEKEMNYTEARRCLLKAWPLADNFNLLMDCAKAANFLFKHENEQLYSDWGKAYVLKAWKYAEKAEDLLSYINCAEDIFKGEQQNFGKTGHDKMQWYTLHKDYKNYLLAMACKDIVFVEDIILQAVDAINLIKTGCVYSTKLYKGELCVVTDVKSLIFSKNWNVLEHYLKIIQPSQKDILYLLKLYVDEEKEEHLNSLKLKYEANRTKDKWIDEIEALAYNALFADAEKTVIKHLPGYLNVDVYGYSNIKTYVQSAKISRLILSDPYSALDYLKYASDDIEDFYDDLVDYSIDEYLSCIIHWKQLFNDDLNAMAILSKEFNLQKSDHKDDFDGDDLIKLCKLSEFWKKYYNDDDEAVRCLLKAEKINNQLQSQYNHDFESSNEIINDYWKRLFDGRLQ